MYELGSVLYYMAPIQNAMFISLVGILSFNRRQASPAALNSYVRSIADPSVNDRRQHVMVGGRSLHDYVPLYWATHTPMQYVATKKQRTVTQEDLVFFVIKAQEVLNLEGTWTTDGNAASGRTSFYEGVGAIPYLDWKILGTPDCYRPEYKQKKCAEVLVPDQLGPQYFLEMAVRNEQVAQKFTQDIEALLSKVSSAMPDAFAPTVVARPEFYY